MNCPEFVKEFQSYVEGMNVKNILEVGAQSGELMKAVNADGIDLAPKLPEVSKCDIREYTGKRYGLVFSSGLIEHYSKEKAVEILRAKAKASRKYVLTYVPNTNCLAYRKNKARTSASWKNELDYTVEGLAKLHEQAGLEVIDKGTAGKEWAKRFGPEPSEPYLVYCLSVKQS